MNSLRFEQGYPYLIALLCAGAWYFFGQPFPSHTATKEFLAAALGLAGTVVGFLAAAQSILMALPSDSVMGQLRKSGYIDSLVRYIREAFYSLASFALLNLAGFYFDLEQPLPLRYKVAWVLLGVLGLCCFQRVMEILLKIMRRR